MQSAPPLVLRHDLASLDPLVDQHQLAWADFALELRADEVERARLRRDDPVAVEPAEAERAHAARVAEGDQLSLGERDHRERAVEPAHRVRDGVAERRRIVGDQRGDHLGVGGGGERVTAARRAPRAARPAFVRLPLWPSAIVRALPCWTSGCAFHHCDEPVVE